MKIEFWAFIYYLEHIALQSKGVVGIAMKDAWSSNFLSHDTGIVSTAV